MPAETKATQTIKCPHCGELTRARDTCPYCKRSLAAPPEKREPKKCPTCHRPYAQSLSECPHCATDRLTTSGASAVTLEEDAPKAERAASPPQEMRPSYRMWFYDERDRAVRALGITGLTVGLGAAAAVVAEVTTPALSSAHLAAAAVSLGVLFGLGAAVLAVLYYGEFLRALLRRWGRPEVMGTLAFASLVLAIVGAGAAGWAYGIGMVSNRLGGEFETLRCGIDRTVVRGVGRAQFKELQFRCGLPTGEFAAGTMNLALSAVSDPPPTEMLLRARRGLWGVWTRAPELPQFGGPDAKGP